MAQRFQYCSDIIQMPINRQQNLAQLPHYLNSQQRQVQVNQSNVAIARPDVPIARPNVGNIRRNASGIELGSKYFLQIFVFHK